VTDDADRLREGGIADRVWRIAVSKQSIAGLGLAVIVILALLTPGFTSSASVNALINTASFIGCIAVGMTFITLSGNIMSFSLGAATGLAAITCASMTRFGLAAALLAPLMLSVAINALQGFVIGFFRANSLIVSIAALALINAVAEIATASQTIYVEGDALDAFKGRLWGIPLAGVAFLASVIVGQAILRHTQFGQSVVLLGSNSRAATAAGVEVWRTTTLVYAMAGLFSGISGVLLAARYGAGTIEMGSGFDYSAIAGVLLGGTAIAGGQGSVTRSLVGVAVMAVVAVVLLLRDFETQYQYLLTGLIVFIAVLAQGRFRP
jgi:ribose/xylose/arabinose/galactoside ABC-type transport system permease subunit